MSPSSGPRLGDNPESKAQESLAASATKIWAVRALGELPGAEWAPPKRRARRFNATLTLEGGVILETEAHGESVAEQLKPPRMRQPGAPFEVRTRKHTGWR